MKPRLPIANRRLIVGEPELKWCEALLTGIAPVRIDDGFGGQYLISACHPTGQQRILELNTNLDDARIAQALRVLRHQKRI